MAGLQCLRRLWLAKRGLSAAIAWNEYEHFPRGRVVFNTDPRFVRERFSVVLERMVHELRGTPCIVLEDATPDRKSFVASRSFGRLVLLPSEVAEANCHTHGAAEKIRRQHLATANLTVFVETNRFKPDQPQHCASQGVQLSVATADTGKLVGVALRGLRMI